MNQHVIHVVALTTQLLVVGFLFGGCSSDNGNGNGSTVGKCTGIPHDCDTLYAGSCSAVSGCSLNIDPFGNDMCQGMPEECSMSATTARCVRQGCQWTGPPIPPPDAG